MTTSTDQPTLTPRTARPRTFAQAEAVLAQALPGYESRPHQRRLATEIETEFFGGARQATSPVIVQGVDEPVLAPRAMFGHAPTGSGKSLAYLIPAILSGQRVVVSVTTKSLQEQLAGSDLPFLQEHLGVPFTWAVLKGRSNYLCMNRVREMIGNGEAPASVQALVHLVEQADENFSGLREDIGMDIPDDLWWRISGSDEECDALDCKDDEEGNCYLYRARRRALRAQIVVVNHALYCNDMSVRKMTAGNFSLLGQIDWTILDEAHEFHEVALSSLATRLTEASFVSLVNNVRTWMSNNADPQALGNAERFMGQVVAGARSLFAALPTSRSGEAMRIRGHHLEPLFDASVSLMDALSELSEVLISVRPQGEPEVREKAKKRQTSLARRIVNASSSLNALLTADLSEYVRWTETERTRRGPRLVLKMSPVDISEHLRSHLFAYHPVLMVSATLAVRGTFDFQADQLGVDNWTGTIVGTSFDHAANTRLYVPLTLPAPNQDGWESAAINEMRSLIAAAGGRTLVLFTSVAHMRRTYEVLKDALPYPVKVQGQESTSALKDWFLADPETVLLATKSFMTGFDARGETLSQVIITKMPFPVPTDPMFEARSELVKRRGGSDFADLSIPTMSIVLQQAVGRLMRHSTDMGVVAILDHRMISKGYGKQIVRDLPPMTLVKDRAEAEAFLLDTAKHFARSAS